ncbi:MAG: hypothetical protein K8T25_07080 [Planctomycetia bacterium]|nr:hypothetical protein [Planctomycetia bacterium]
MTKTVRCLCGQPFIIVTGTPHLTLCNVLAFRDALDEHLVIDHGWSVRAAYAVVEHEEYVALVFNEPHRTITRPAYVWNPETF